jgi:hypothetical protein
MVTQAIVAILEESRPESREQTEVAGLYSRFQGDTRVFNTRDFDGETWLDQ